jgi:hydroxyquinol 1,2-dioxygenase
VCTQAEPFSSFIHISINKNKNKNNINSVKMNPMTQAIVDQIDENTPDERTKTVMKSLVKHLHAFVQDVRLTPEEWKTAVDFLTRTGQKCNEHRQEYILLSDVLGVSILVDALNSHDDDNDDDLNDASAPPSQDDYKPKSNAATTATESTILGPFFRESAPTLDNGALLTTPDQIAKGTPLVVDCRVVDGPSDIPVTNCTVNVWQASAEGLYDVQTTTTTTSTTKNNNNTNHESTDLRGIFHPVDGRFWFYTVQPSSYPVPTDGPVGELLTAMGRHPYRPAHIHFQVSAPGFETLTTQLFMEGDPYLTNTTGDAVHAVKDSLIVRLTKRTGEDPRYRLPDELRDYSAEVYELRYTLRLKQRRHRRGLNDRHLVDI